MSMQSSSRNLNLYLIITAAVVAAALFRIADLDFFWHLKTGDVILKTHEFQRTEIYSFTAAGREYIDHEWLFQVVISLFYSAFGPAGIITLKTIILAIMYLITTRLLLKEGASFSAVFAIQFLSICGSMQRMIERPEIFTALFFVITFVIVHSFLKSGKSRSLLILPPLFIIWANFHAAVILGIVLLFCFCAGLFLETLAKRSDFPVYYDADVRKKVLLLATLAVCVLVTGINPYGYRVLTVPFELTSIINSGLLNNEEWQAPSPLTLPFYYVCVLLTFAVMLINFRRLSIVHFLLAIFFAYISMKYVRNTGMFSWFMPLFLTPYVGQFSGRTVATRAIAGFAALSLLYVLTVSFPFERGVGIASYFPQQIAKFTKEKKLQGNMLNSYAMGGYFIWSLYPERKIFIDGRNEVYLPLLKEIVKSRADSRLWNKLLADYRIEYALLNYVDDLEEVTNIGNNGEIKKTYMPFSETHFPRKKWALIYWDDVGMVLVKRNGVNAELLNLEYKQIYPEGHNYMEALLMKGLISRDVAQTELKRKLTEDPNCKRAKKLLSLAAK
ncbi:MAG TPA: hypothetical protein VLH08_16185 [Acidobacteriota bacterium]|nr:hypothetical protein [Acidobacteriota bacterium]